MKTKYIILSIFAFLAFSSCSLEEEPYGFYSESNFYKTNADALSAVNYVYDAMTYLEYFRSIVFLGDMNTSELHTKSSESQAVRDISNWNTTNFSTSSILSTFFKYSYITINRANSVIENVSQMNIDENLKNQYVGQAYFLRGFSYFKLTTNFGLVPIHKTTVSTLDETAVPAAESLDEIWDFIISDLKEAVDLMSFNTTIVVGHADKATAAGMLSKVYLYLASAKEHGVSQYSDMDFDVDEYYTNAVTYATMVVDNAEQTTYSLEPNLLNIYDVDNPSDPELMWLMSMDRTGESEGQYSKLSKYFLPWTDAGTVNIINASDSTMIQTHAGWSVYQTGADFYDSFEDNDRRKTWLICNTLYNEDGTVYQTYPGSLEYPFCRKFIDPEYIGDKTSTKPILLRYSDVALTYAEAAGPTSKAYALVNAIRERAGLSDLDANLSKDDFREAVYNERKYELAFEGNRSYDIRRWNRMATEIVEVKSQGLTADDVIFYPIPSSETYLNSYLK